MPGGAPGPWCQGVLRLMPTVPTAPAHPNGLRDPTAGPNSAHALPDRTRVTLRHLSRNRQVKDEIKTVIIK